MVRTACVGPSCRTIASHCDSRVVLFTGNSHFISFRVEISSNTTTCLRRVRLEVPDRQAICDIMSKPGSNAESLFFAVSFFLSTTLINYRRQGDCFRRCLSVCLLATNFQTDLHEIFREGWQWAKEQMIKFWWQSRSRIRIRIRIRIRFCIATLVRRALAEVCTVPVLLVFSALQTSQLAVFTYHGVVQVVQSACSVCVHVCACVSVCIRTITVKRNDLLSYCISDVVVELETLARSSS